MKDKSEELREICMPLVEWLKKYANIHTQVIVNESYIKVTSDELGIPLINDDNKIGYKFDKKDVAIIEEALEKERNFIDREIEENLEWERHMCLISEYKDIQKILSKLREMERIVDE